MYSLKFISLSAVIVATTGSAQVINNDTLIPLGMIIGAMTTTCIVVWKVAVAHTNQKRDNIELRARLERLEKSS